MLNYVSLFSSAGVGCYGFKQEGFECIATVEFLEKRMQIQKYNNKCKNEDGYIVGDIETEDTHQRLENVILDYFKNVNKPDIDVIIATPPCQGMSVANHKKKDELKRNSLVVESIKITAQYLQKIFIYENVRAFSNSVCTDIDGVNKSIDEAIFNNLSEQYHIDSQVLNLKSYGSNSSRTRTIVIGVRRDLEHTCPLLFFPDYKREKTLEQVIGHLPRLKKMGQFSENDFFHSFRPYQDKMIPWIKATPYGKSAFDNKNDQHKPHKVIDGEIVINQQKNADKYQRQLWNRTAPCIHTRNDCLASQNTLHPEDDRAFSIRELMLMMSIPDDFNWIDPSIDLGEAVSYKQKDKIRSNTEKLIRESIGEAVPTGVMRDMANKIKNYLNSKPLSDDKILTLIEEFDLYDPKNLQAFIKKSKDLYIADVYKVCEMANPNRDENAAFHTPISIAYSCIERLPKENYFKGSISALEPSVGAGIFVFLLAKKYPNTIIEFDCVDLDEHSLATVKVLASRFNLHNLHINYIHDDFILSDKLKPTYDVIVGNPPFKKITDGKLLKSYQRAVSSTTSNNIFTYFIEKSLRLGKELVLISPKALLEAPDYLRTRKLLESHEIKHINDFNEKAFKVRIETISFYVSVNNKRKVNEKKNDVIINSYLNKTLICKSQTYITENGFDTWLLYRDKRFDETCKTLEFGVFNVFRDRHLTMKNTKSSGQYRVMKARNIGNNVVIDDPKINRYTDSLDGLAVAKYIDIEAILVPNLTYNPRAVRKPKGCVVDGSAAVLYSESGFLPTDSDIEYFGSSEFNHFYRVARNYGTRSLNIDRISVNYFGIKKKLTNA